MSRYIDADLLKGIARFDTEIGKKSLKRIESIIDVMVEIESFKTWHDLREDAEDMPIYDDKVIICYYSEQSEQNEYAMAWHDKHLNMFTNGVVNFSKVIAWKEIGWFKE